MLSLKVKEKIVMYQLGLGIAQFLIVIFMLNLSSGISRLSKERLVAIQTSGGGTIVGTTQDQNFRADETIRSFIQNWLVLSLDWNTSDEQIRIARGKSVPASMYAGSTALSGKNNFNDEFLEEMHELININVNARALGRSTVSSSVEIEYISLEPRKIRDGEWQVEAITSWKLITTNNGVEQIARVPFNKRITLKATPASIPEAESFAGEYKALQKTTANIEAFGLKITNIEEL